MVFQSYALFPHLTVAENIVFGLKVRKLPAPERRTRLERVAELVGLAKQLDRKPQQLSGGQRQRVALARAIVSQNPICLMDEPLSNLDAQLRHDMRVEIRALQRRLGMTVVYVTHDQVEAMSMADHVVLLREGRIEQEGSPAELYSRPATTFAARFIGTPAMNLVPLRRHATGRSRRPDRRHPSRAHPHRRRRRSGNHHERRNTMAPTRSSPRRSTALRSSCGRRARWISPQARR